MAYTSQLEGMLRDIKHSHDLMNEFKVFNAYGYDLALLLNKFMPLVIARRPSYPIQFQSEHTDIWILAILYTCGNQPATWSELWYAGAISKEWPLTKCTLVCGCGASISRVLQHKILWSKTYMAEFIGCVWCHGELPQSKSTGWWKAVNIDSLHREPRNWHWPCYKRW